MTEPVKNSTDSAPTRAERLKAIGAGKPDPAGTDAARDARAERLKAIGEAAKR